MHSSRVWTVFQVPRRFLALAVALGVALLMVVTPATPRAHADEEPTTLTVAVVDPTVDSLNPFTSIYRLPTQIHRLMYDYLTNYDAKDATPSGVSRRRGTTAPTSSRGRTPSATLQVVRRPAGHRRGRAWTFNKMMTDDAAATPTAATSKLQEGHRDRRADRWSSS